MSIVEISIKRPLLIIVIFTVLALAGIFAYTKLNYELLPKFKMAYVSIGTLYPGASPAEIEQSVTKPLEEALAGVEKVKRITSSSNPDFSLVNIEFLYGADAEQAFQDVQRKVNEVEERLPAQAKKPVVSKFNINDVPVIKAAATANMTAGELSSLLKNQIKPQLAQLPGMGKIEFIGLEEREYVIQVDLPKIKHYGVSLLQIVNALQQSELNVPAGNISSSGYQQSVRVTGKVENIQALQNVLIVKNNNAEIRLSDVASIVEYAKKKESTSRLENKSVIGLILYKQGNANAVAMSEAIQEKLKSLEATFAERDLKFAIAQDGSVFTVASANAVKVDLLLAIGLVALVMLVFLHSLRSSLIVLISLPTSLLSTLIFMYLLGYTLNLMTLLAMSLVVGILVDDSIVVLENIYRHLEMGKDKIKATIDGREEIGFTAFAITLVDVVVFLPLAFTGGLVGDIVSEFAMVIVISTLFSLIVCFTITPMLASRFGRLEHLTKETLAGRFGLWFESTFKKMEHSYGRLLHWSLAHKGKVILAAFGLFVASLLLPMLGYVGSEFAPRIDRGEMAVTVQMPPGTTLLQAETFSKQLEAQVRSAFPDAARIMTNTGVPAEAWGAPEERNFEMNITFKPKEERTKPIQQLGREIQHLVLAHPGTKVKVAMVGLFGTADEAPVQVLISGAQRDRVNEAALSLQDAVRNIAGTYDVRLSGNTRKYDVQVVPDHDKMARFGVTAADLGMTTRVALVGFDDLKLEEEAETVPIRITLNARDKQNLQAIEGLEVNNADGELVKLSQVARIVQQSAPAMLERTDKNGSVTLFAGVAGRPVGDVGADIRNAIDNLQNTAGVTFNFQGDLANQDDSFGPLGLAFAAGILLMYFIMVALYNSWIHPFVVLFSIPLAIIGALLALGLTGESINIFSIFGMIMMTGLVAKNGILLVDRINQNLNEGKTLAYAIEESGRTRLRPILMTTIAMVLGMLPIALGKGNGAEVKNGLAWAIMGGLTSSMFLTLLVVPVVYAIMQKLMERFSFLYHRMTKAAVATTVVILAVALPNEIFAQDTLRLSVDEAVQMGLKNNAAIRVAALEPLKQQAVTREAWSYRLPQVNVNGSYINNTQIPVVFFPSLRPNPETGELVFGPVQPIKAGSRHSLTTAANASFDLINLEATENIKLAEKNEAVARLQITATQQQVVAEIKKTYNDLILVNAQRAVVQQTIARYTAALQYERDMFNNGFGLLADTLRVFADRETQTLDLIQLDYAEENLLNLLRYLLGQKATTPIVLTDQEITINSATHIDDNGFANRGDIRVLRANMDAARQNMVVAKSTNLPSLTLLGNWQIQGQDDNLEFSRWKFPQSSFVGIGLNIPLFNGFRREARIKQANVAAQQAALQYDDAVNKAQLELIQHTNKYLETQRKQAVQQLVVTAARRSVELLTDRYQKGLAKWLDVKDAELLLSQAQLNAAQLKHQLQATAIELERTNPAP